MDPTAPELPPSPPQLAVPSFQRAGFWRRLLALLIDSIILAIVGWILGFLWSESFMRMGGWERFVGFAVALLYFVPLNSSLSGGQTVGKRAVKIRVVSKEGAPLSIGKSFVRSFVLLLPYFLNGTPVPRKALESGGGILFSEAVFGFGLAIIYLIVFNRRTRQSLHDLVVGSYVVIAGSETAEKPKIWTGHYAVVAVIMILAGVIPFLMVRVAQKWMPKDLVTAYETMLQEPEVAGATVMAGQTVFWDSKKGQRVVNGVTANVRLNKRIENHATEAEKLVRILMEKYPDAGTKDSISIALAEGYDLGISSSFRSHGFNYSPKQWRERLEAASPTPSPAP
ncbi:MAG: hypothetical protein QOK24_2139 [Verrucomicrobiota bacterium]|jgi:uncharacterized RDD family membrane protein YckC